MVETAMKSALTYPTRTLPAQQPEPLLELSVRPKGTLACVRWDLESADSSAKPQPPIIRVSQMTRGTGLEHKMDKLDLLWDSEA